MDRYDFFWETMKLCNWDSFVGDKNALAPLIRVLSKLPDETIFSFEDVMVELLYALDTRKLFTQCKKANPNAGDYMFLNARCAALTGGKEYYEKVKACKMKRVWGRTWALKYRKHSCDYPHEMPLCYKTGSNGDGWNGCF